MPFPSCYFVPSCFTLHTCYFMHQFFHASYLLFVICTPTGVFLWIYFRLQASDIYSLAFWFPSFLLFHLHSNDIDTLRSDKAHSPFFFLPSFLCVPRPSLSLFHSSEFNYRFHTVVPLFISCFCVIWSLFFLSSFLLSSISHLSFSITNYLTTLPICLHLHLPTLRESPPPHSLT